VEHQPGRGHGDTQRGVIALIFIFILHFYSSFVLHLPSQIIYSSSLFRVLCLEFSV
jgi:hypothetical protein